MIMVVNLEQNFWISSLWNLRGYLLGGVKIGFLLHFHLKFQDPGGQENKKKVVIFQCIFSYFRVTTFAMPITEFKSCKSYTKKRSMLFLIFKFFMILSLKRNDQTELQQPFNQGYVFVPWIFIINRDLGSIDHLQGGEANHVSDGGRS